MISHLGKGMNKKKLKVQIIEVLAELERNGGNDAYKQIKLKIPTYCSVL